MPAVAARSTPPMFIRHSVVARDQVLGAGRRRVARLVGRHRDADTSGFFSENVPPKPQHWSASGSSRTSMPRTACSSCIGRSPTRAIRSEWQVGW